MPPTPVTLRNNALPALKMGQVGIIQSELDKELSMIALQLALESSAGSGELTVALNRGVIHAKERAKTLYVTDQTSAGSLRKKLWHLEKFISVTSTTIENYGADDFPSDDTLANAVVFNKLSLTNNKEISSIIARGIGARLIVLDLHITQLNHRLLSATDFIAKETGAAVLLTVKTTSTVTTTKLGWFFDWVFTLNSLSVSAASHFDIDPKLRCDWLGLVPTRVPITDIDLISSIWLYQCVNSWLCVTDKPAPPATHFPSVTEELLQEMVSKTMASNS